ncbi:galactose mutarotase-like protein [Pluteus cervinus]|uniref:Galactose mutarotase-like protein n=1 Tax=Pluteus cervinus TaxID=181527 RepID=A0ACD3BH61_9AGAR|nr:galactose mutarotase-like protein [Pluteus cervinus]
MPVEIQSDKVVLRHPRGSSAEVLLYGATVISWRCPTERNPEIAERLFVSGKAALDGSKPVRGGIPVIFPCFGPPTHPEHMKLSQHGFARSESWSWDTIVSDDDKTVSARLTLGPTPGISERFQRPFQLSFVVGLSEYGLSTDLHVKNTSTSTAFPPETLDFQALFHNYIRAPASDVLVTPLQHLQYYDKTESTEVGRATAKKEERAGVDVHKFTDSVYEDASQNYEVTWRGGGISIKAANLKDVVVWNPQEEAGSKIGDMEAGGWERYVCVEPGYVRGFVQLPPDHTWVGHQTLAVIQEERRLT